MCFCTKFSDADFNFKVVLRSDRYCFTVSVAANLIKIGGVFTYSALTKLVNKHSFGRIQVPRGRWEKSKRRRSLQSAAPCQANRAERSLRLDLGSHPAAQHRDNSTCSCCWVLVRGRRQQGSACGSLDGWGGDFVCLFHCLTSS